jgi:hypothetical protein
MEEQRQATCREKSPAADVFLGHAVNNADDSEKTT